MGRGRTQPDTHQSMTPTGIESNAAPWRTVLVLGLVGALLAGWAVSPAGGRSGAETAGSVERPGRLVLTSGGLMIRAALGSRCLYDRPPGDEPRNILCTDVLVSPLPTRAALPVKGGRRLLIRTGAPATAVSVSYDKPNRTRTDSVAVFGSRKARRVDETGLRWRTKLPKRVGAARVVRVFVRFRGLATASFGARIGTGRRCRRTRNT